MGYRLRSLRVERCGVDLVEFPHRDRRVPYVLASGMRLVADDEVQKLATIDHGQVVAYAGDRPVATAKNAVRRVGTHSKYGFGELRLRPSDADRVPARLQASDDRPVGESS